MNEWDQTFQDVYIYIYKMAFNKRDLNESCNVVLCGVVIFIH